MQLNFKKSGEGEPLIILHGLFGMLDNWQTAAKEFEKHNKVYLIDQRNHGKSPHTAEHSYRIMSGDLLEFFEQQGIESANILGHSMGGKTAMQFAVDHAAHVKKLIVVDMGIRQYAPGHDKIFDALFAIDLNTIHYRSDAEKILLEKIPDFGTRQFILKNLTRETDGTYNWKFNLKSIYDNYNEFILAPVAATHVFNGDTLFIRGEHSDYIQDSDWPAVKDIFPKASLVTVKGAGHWVHADKPQDLIKIVSGWLNKVM